MEARIVKLEEFAQETRDRLARIEATLATTASKEDVADLRSEMHKAFTEQTWRILGAMFTFGTLLSGAVFFIARNVH